MDQSEECAMKRVFCVIIWYNNVVGKSSVDFLPAGLIVLSLVTGFSYILIIVLLQELIVFPYRLQIIVRPWAYLMCSLLMVISKFCTTNRFLPSFIDETLNQHITDHFYLFCQWLNAHEPSE